MAEPATATIEQEKQRAEALAAAAKVDPAVQAYMQNMVEKATKALDASRLSYEKSTEIAMARMDAVLLTAKDVLERRREAAAKVRTPWTVDSGDEARRSGKFSPDVSLTAQFYNMCHTLGSPHCREPLSKLKDSFIRAGHFPDAVERAMSGLIDTSGGFLIGEQTMEEIIPALYPDTPVLQAGVRVLNLPAGVGQVRYPKVNARPSVTAVTEAQAPTESTPTYQSVVFNPHGIGMLMAIPMQILKYATPAVEAHVAELVRREIAVEWDRQMLRGLGAANEVLGISQVSGVTSNAIGANGGAISYAIITDQLTLVLETNIGKGKGAWITSPRGFREIMQLLDSQNRPLFHSSFFAPGLPGAQPNSILGYPIYTTTNIPTNISKGSGTNLTELYMSPKWDDALFMTWGGLEVRQSRDATDGTNNAFTQGLLLVVARQEADFSPFHNNGFSITPDMNSA